MAADNIGILLRGIQKPLINTGGKAVLNYVLKTLLESVVKWIFFLSVFVLRDKNFYLYFIDLYRIFV